MAGTGQREFLKRLLPGGLPASEPGLAVLLWWNQRLGLWITKMW